MRMRMCTRNTGYPAVYAPLRTRMQHWQGANSKQAARMRARAPPAHLVRDPVIQRNPQHTAMMACS